MARCGVIALVCAFAAAASAASASAETVLVVKGRGWGHGVGMSQWGARGYAERGWPWRRILAHYYPGTTPGPAGVARVRVLLAAARRSVEIGCAAPLTVNDASGRGRPLPAGTYRVDRRFELPVGHRRVRVKHPLRRSSPIRVVRVKRPLRAPLVFECDEAPLTWNGRPYHGLLVLRRAGARVAVVNSLPLDDYVRGVVADEMPSDWPRAALEAQAVAARSYALATLRPARHFDLYADVRSQVYGGIWAEAPETNAAVAGTAGTVLTWKGRVASTYFFSTSGGRTANVGDVWSGGDAMPYLRSVADPYDAASPHHTWGPVALPERRLRRLLGAEPHDVTLERTPSGRVRTVVVDGRRIEASRFRRVFGLESTWFDVGELSLSASRPQVVYGGKLELLARTRRAGTALLQRRVGAGPWRTLARVDTGGRVSVEPRAHTLYRLTGAGVRGPVVAVAVAPRLSVTPAAATLLRGTVAPRSGGAITVLRRVGSSWQVVARPRVGANGSFSAPVRLRPGGYRVTVAGDGRLAPTARTVRVTHRLLASLR